jgi:hypothetical protein
LILSHRLPVGTHVCEVKRCVVCRVPSTETRPAPGAQRLCLRSGAVSKPRPVPDTKTWNEDINFGLHVNAPLRKHFVVGSGASTVTFLSTTCLKSSVTFC